MKRSMCLYVPYLPIERLANDCNGPAPNSVPFAVTQSQSGAVRVVLCNHSAADGGVCQGMTLAEATAVLPSLQSAAKDEQGGQEE